MSDKTNPNEVALLIERTGLPIKEIAELTGYSPKTVYRWESGETTPRKAVLDKLHRLAGLDSVSASELNSQFSFIDLFAGIGGFRRAFESVGGHCVYTSEWNKYARETYTANFDCNHPISGDITKVAENEIPPHDVLLGGFPCQPFSIAGVSKKNSLGRQHGFKDKTQGTLFFDVARILAYHRPAAFLLENVKNLVRHDKGNTFRVIGETLDELGYKWQWRVVDAKGFVPQHRERVFIAGFREETDFDFETLLIPDSKRGPKLNSILHGHVPSEEPEPPYTQADEALPNEKYTLSDKLWNYLQAYAEKHQAKGNGFSFGLNDHEGVARTLSARYYKDGSEILIEQPGENPRRLTPRECARLMGFDEPGREPMVITVSDTQAYKQFGNAVVVPVVRAVAEHMKPHILMSKNASEGVQLNLAL